MGKTRDLSNYPNEGVTLTDTQTLTNKTLTAPIISSPSVTGLPASSVDNTPSGSISSTTVQAAINELDTEKQPLDAELTAIAGLISAANKVPYFTGSQTAGLLDFLDEDDLISNSSTAVASQQSIKAYVDAAAGSSVFHARDEKTSGTAGGSSSAGANTRVLNTVKTNTTTGASLSSNQITLPAGTWDIYARAPAFQANRHRIYLYNITDTSTALYGSNAYSSVGDSVPTDSVLIGRITIASTKVYEVRHYTQGAVATDGLGVEISDGNPEVYAEIEIRRVNM